MRKFLFAFFISFFLNISANDSISIWQELYSEAMQLQKYEDAEKNIDKLIKAWKQKHVVIDNTYLYLLFYKCIPLTVQNKWKEAEPLIDEILSNWDLLGETKESEMYSLLLRDKSIVLEERGEHVANIIPLVLESLDVNSKLFGRRSKENISTLIRLSGFYRKMGEYHTALKYSEECVSISREFLAANDNNLATYLLILSEDYALIGNYRKSIDASMEGASIYKDNLGENSEPYAKSLIETALSYSEMNDNKKAINYLQQAVKICKNIDSRIILRTALDGLARTYSHKGEYKKAISFEEEAIKLSKELGEEGNDQYITMLSNLGAFYSKMADYKTTIDIQTSTVDLSKRIWGTKSPLYATSIANLGATYLEIGEYEEAYKYSVNALNIRREIKDEVGLVNSLQGLALISVEMGNYTIALKYGKEAMELCKRVIGENHSTYASCLSTYATCNEISGNYQRAIEYEKKALDVRNRIFGCYHPDYAQSMGQLAIIYQALNEHEKAIEYGTLNLNLVDSIYGTNHPVYANSLGNLAEYYASSGNISKAISLQEKAKGIKLSLYGENSIFYATSIGNIANYLAAQKKYKEAVNNQQKALDIFKRKLGEYHPQTLQCVFNLSAYYEKMHDYQKAISYEERAIQLMQNNVLSLLGDMTSNSRTEYWKSVNNKFLKWNPRLNYYSKVKDASFFYNTILFAKGILINTEIDLANAVTNSGSLKALDIYSNLKQNRTILNKLYTSSIPSDNVEIDSIRNIIDKQENELISLVKEYREYTKALKVKCEDVKLGLGNNDLAIEFVHFPINNDSLMYIALSLRKNSEYPKMTVLFEEKQLKQVSDTLYYQCKDMTDLIWKPLQSELEGIKNVYFSPSGALHNIGIEYLPGMEDYNIYRLSSTRELVTNKKNEAENSVVLYGGLDYYASIDYLNQERMKYPKLLNEKERSADKICQRGAVGKLKYSIDEINQIAKELSNVHKKFILRTDSEGTEESFKALSGEGVNILHLSTHGFYWTEEQAKERHGLQFLKMSINDKVQISTEDKALSRSGLFLSGANHALMKEKIPDEIEDGILTAKEVSVLDLQGLDLVVLSACQTGLGDIAQGEGVFGLQRGFKKAGARTILMSLWKVNDEATQILMSQFYKHLLSGKSKYQSLHLSQQYLREYRNKEGEQCYNLPKYWAAFILLDGN